MNNQIYKIIEPNEPGKFIKNKKKCFQIEHLFEHNLAIEITQQERDFVFVFLNSAELFKYFVFQDEKGKHIYLQFKDSDIFAYILIDDYKDKIKSFKIAFSDYYIRILFKTDEEEQMIRKKLLQKERESLEDFNFEQTFRKHTKIEF